MIEAIFGILYVGTSYEIVKKFRPQAFTSTEPRQLATDIALTAAGAVTVAPIVVLGVALKQLASVGMACMAVRR